MRILALETSGTSASAAALDEERVLAEAATGPGQRTAQRLAPVIADVLAQAGWRPQDVDLVAASQGPGSFTGLRIGAATAKVFAYAAGAEILGVNTLEAIAAQAPLDCGEVWSVFDAHRGELFVARFRLLPDRAPEEVYPTRTLPIDDWLGERSADQWVTGAGLTRVGSRLPHDAPKVDTSLWPPRAATVGRLALLHYRQGRRDDLWSFSPRYYRPSAAEEKTK